MVEWYALLLKTRDYYLLHVSGLEPLALVCYAANFPFAPHLIHERCNLQPSMLQTVISLGSS